MKEYNEIEIQLRKDLYVCTHRTNHFSISPMKQNLPNPPFIVQKYLKTKQIYNKTFIRLS